ncbi:PREDICTED: uncharacterized protein LOC108766757 [Trachymyrmex cornetzi]|uniref:uncharacterized protein LOC108766757 n=1 Tax=Trachymyrmex cornetzi TaxID=471704 RepID=UPI00084F1A95|nr:PREDICTED: uncharacterized protein LOC108766757 [Trachymyrmex cornetzi]
MCEKWIQACGRKIGEIKEKNAGALKVMEDPSTSCTSDINNETQESTGNNSSQSTNKKMKEKMLKMPNEEKFTHEMTIKLLEIVQTKFHLLNHKMHAKKKIWIDVATEMQNNSYLTNYNGIKCADKCHQRWRNLEKMYHGHCRYMKSTSTGKKKPPKYFDEMHDLIGEKHSSKSVNFFTGFWLLGKGFIGSM